MKNNMPKWNVLQEYVLYYGEDWVCKKYNISLDKLDSLIYGGQLPNEKMKYDAKNVTKKISWTKFNNDVERIVDELGEDIELADVSVIEEVALEFQKKNGVQVLSEIKDSFIWDKPTKTRLIRENKQYREEYSDDFSEDIVQDILKNYKKEMSRISHKGKYVIGDISSKTKEDVVQEMFLRCFEKKYYYDPIMTNRVINLKYKKVMFKNGVEMYVENEDKVQKVFDKNEFESGTIYVIRCWNDCENFYKIGYTSGTVKGRFLYKRTSLPYKFEIIKTFFNKKAHEIEKEFHESNKLNDRYVPKLKFSGCNECYSKNMLKELEKAIDDHNI